MSDILKIDTISQYNDLYGIKTRNPLVDVVHLNTPETRHSFRMTVGFYSVFLKETKGCEMTYGQSKYDFDAQTVMAIAPGQTVGYANDSIIPPKTVGLFFHPDFIRGTSLGPKIKQYSFFSYESNEALHLSDEELPVLNNLLSVIETELNHPIDKHSRSLICANIELLLDYCMRFYERQFVSRSDMNRDVLARFEKFLDGYLDSGLASQQGFPTVKYFADKICLSPNYFGDLVKKETGKSAKEYILLKLFDVSKERLMDKEKSVSQIADTLGFQYPQHFIRFFKKYEGITPSQYRR